MMKILKFLYTIVCTLFADPIFILKKYLGLPYYFKSIFIYTKKNNTNFKIKILDIYPILHERFSDAGVAKGAYFLQDIWAAKYVYNNNIKQIIDIGSRIDGFIAHILPYCKVEYIDLRPLHSNLENLTFRQGDITNLPFKDDTIKYISCLHVLEHIGLGRYGDKIEPEGYIIAAKELSRVLKPGGILLLSTPVGKEKLHFNAHRVFDPVTIMKIFGNLNLIEFDLIDDKAEEIFYNANFEDARKCNYGCGLFIFTKK